MIFCNKCFINEEISSIIKSKQHKGNCPTCRNNDVYLYNTDLFNELNGKFDEIIEIYTPENQLPLNFPVKEKAYLKDHLKNDWSIFNKNLSSDVIYDIIFSVSREMYDIYPEMFTSPIGLSQLCDEEYLEQNMIIKGKSWDDFVEIIKHINRFHSNCFNNEIFKELLAYTLKHYKKGIKLFRGRICEKEEGFDAENLKPPPKDRVCEGRANSTGIRRLYLSNNIVTTFYETRCIQYDFITVGTFELLEDINVVDFTAINNINPFLEDFNLVRYLVNKRCLDRMSHEMSKNVKSKVNSLEYIPTQFITDFINSIYHKDTEGNIIYDYQGIEYESTLNSGWRNLVIFNPDLFSCNNVETYKVSQLNYQYYLA